MEARSQEHLVQEWGLGLQFLCQNCPDTPGKTLMMILMCSPCSNASWEERRWHFLAESCRLGDLELELTWVRTYVPVFFPLLLEYL